MNSLVTSRSSGAKLTRAGAFFMLLPAILLAAGVLGWIAMIRVAVGDPSAAIEPDYYNQATNTDRDKAISSRSHELGWSAHVQTFVVRPDGSGKLTLRVADRESRPMSDLRVSVTAFPNARSGDRQTLRLVSNGDGTYTAHLARARIGIWELRVSATSAAEEFRTTLRHELIGEARR